jgi:hypothetical protein
MARKSATKSSSSQQPTESSAVLYKASNATSALDAQTKRLEAHWTSCWKTSFPGQSVPSCRCLHLVHISAIRCWKYDKMSSEFFGDVMSNSHVKT